MTTGILLVQLGTPENASIPAVRAYLKEFLADPLVIDANRVFWFFLLNGVILRTRPQKSALLYDRFFSLYGRTLEVYSQALAEKLTHHLNSDEYIIDYAMRYGSPSIREKLSQFESCEQVIIVPLFPQYSRTTTGSVEKKVGELLADKTSYKICAPYYSDPNYVNSLSGEIEKELINRDKKPDHILLSYHGLPKRYVDNGDPYYDHCRKTTEALREKLIDYKIPISTCFQSRFGKEEWLKPYTDEIVRDLAKDGITDVMIACPSFTMDCLETLDEIGSEVKKIFQDNGGERFQLISCLNDSDEWAQNLSEIIRQNQ